METPLDPVEGQPFMDEKSGDRGRDQLGVRASRGGGEFVQLRREVGAELQWGIGRVGHHLSPETGGARFYSTPARTLYASVQDGSARARRKHAASDLRRVCCRN